MINELISIHVPYERGRRRPARRAAGNLPNFNPRPLREGTTHAMRCKGGGGIFQSTSPTRGDDDTLDMVQELRCYFNPRPLREGTTHERQARAALD